MRSGRPICAPHRLSGVSPNVAFENSSNVGLIDDGPFSSSQQGRSLSASSFYASSLPQAIDGVVSLALCPQVVLRVSNFLKTSDLPRRKPPTCDGCFFPPCSVSALSFPLTPACPGQPIASNVQCPPPPTPPFPLPPTPPQRDLGSCTSTSGGFRRGGRGVDWT